MESEDALTDSTIKSVKRQTPKCTRMTEAYLYEPHPGFIPKQNHLWAQKVHDIIGIQMTRKGILEYLLLGK